MRSHPDIIAMESIANLIIGFFKFTYPITKEQIDKMINQTGGIIIEDSKNNHFYPVTNILNDEVVEKYSKIEDITNYFNANPAFIRELLENSNTYYVAFTT